MQQASNINQVNTTDEISLVELFQKINKWLDVSIATEIQRRLDGGLKKSLCGFMPVAILKR